MSEWDDYADGWDRDEGARAYAGGAFSSLGEALAGRGLRLTGATVIDFGCGTGLLTERLVAAGASVRAVDSSAAMLAVLDEKITARGWTNVETSPVIPTGPGTHDLIVCSSVCSFLDDYPGTVAQLVALLRPGGLFVQWDWERDGEDGHGLTRTEVTDALAGAGLVDVLVDVGFVVSFGEETMSPLMGLGQKPAPATG